MDVHRLNSTRRSLRTHRAVAYAVAAGAMGRAYLAAQS